MLRRNGHVLVGSETGEFARITLVVAEMRTVAVQHEKHLSGRRFLHRPAQFVEQLHVVAGRADIDQVFGVAGQLVDHGPLRRLVRNEPGLESGFLEKSGNPRAAVQLRMFVGGHRRKNQRHALVRGVALGQDVAEEHQIADFGQLGVGLPVVAEQLPAHRPRGFSYYIYVNLAPRSFVRAPCAVGKPGGSLLEIVAFAELRSAQVHVVEHVERKDLVAQHVPVFADAVGGPQGERAQRENRCAGQSDGQARRGGDIAFVADLPGGEPQQRQINRTDHEDRGIDVAQQFAGLARIGRQHVGEHVGGDDRVAEQVEQYDLEGTEEDEGKGQPDHHARPFERHAPHHVESQRHEDQRLDRPARVGLGIGQHAVGNDERHEKIDGQQRREPAAGADGVTFVRSFRRRFHLFRIKKPR